MDILSEIANKRRINRRKFLAGVGAAGAATALAGCGGPAPYNSTGTTTTTSYTDTDILNFALNLEYLEAEFYLRAATGSGLTTADAGTGAGTVVAAGTTQLTGLSTAQQNIINEIAFDEQAHVRFLRSALGTSAVARPNLDLMNSFNGLASAAGIGASFNPYASFNNFLVGAFIFEDVGVTAYHGAAGLISQPGIAAGYLAAAAGIMAVEAYHAAYVRTSITALAIAGSPTYLTYANQVAALRANLSGGSSPSAGFETALQAPVGTPPFTTTVPTTPTTIVAADSNAIAYARTTDQVLHIVYGTFSNTAGATTPAAGVAKGGFFPNGLNGNITVTQS